MLNALITLWISLLGEIVSSVEPKSTSGNNQFTKAERNAVCKALYGEYRGSE